MLRNFEVRGAVEVHCAGSTLDLHNDFGLQTLHYDLPARSLVLVWAPLDGRNAPVELRLDGVISLKMMPRDDALPMEDDDCLSLLGFVTPDMEGTDAYLDDASVDDTCHLLLAFEGGWSLKAFADRAAFNF